MAAATAAAPSEEDLSLILSFQMQELEDAQSASSPDWELAKSLLEVDLKQQLQIWNDHVLAASIYRATALDGELIEEEVAREAQSASDRDLAIRIDAGYEIDNESNRAGPSGPPSKRQRTGPALDPEVEAVFKGYLSELRAVCWKDRGRGEGASGSSAKPQNRNPRRVVDCDVCTEPKDDFEAVPLACGHSHCLDCLRLNFRHHMAAEHFDVPRCCEPIPAIHAAEVLDEAELARFQGLLDAAQPGRRVFCGSGCGTLLREAWKKYDIGICLTCGQRTCLMCGGPSHSGICPEDTDTQSLMETATACRWQTCIKCGTLVELAAGCYHILCLCGGSFCYICGAPWKTCQCVSFEETSLHNGRPLAAGRRRPHDYTAQLETLVQEVRGQAEQHARSQLIQLQALQHLRSERIEEREIARAHKLIREQEIREKDAYIREQEAEREKRRVKADREIRMRMLVNQKLSRSFQKTSSRGKGKHRASGGNFDDIADNIVRYALAFELLPPKPPPRKRAANKPPPSSKKPSESREGIFQGMLRLVGQGPTGRVKL